MLDSPSLAEPIVVTGRALPDAAGDRLLGIVRIDEAELARTPSRQLDDIIRSVGGLQLFRRSDARSSHPTSQGVTLRGLAGNGASRALVLLDGVPQADPFGGWIAWPSLDPLSLGEVRITRGGGSVAFGPGALAGVVELSSAMDTATVGAIELGSRQSLDARAALRTDIAGGVIGLSAAAARGDGFVPVTREDRGPADRAAPYRNASARLRWAGDLAAGTELQLGLSAFHDERERGLAFTDNDTDGADASMRLVGRGSWGWTALGYAQWREFESSFASANAARTEARRTSLQYHVPGRAFGWSAELRPPAPAGLEWRVGTDGRRAVGRSEELGSYVAGVATRDRTSGGRTFNAGAFAEIAMSSGPLTISGAARLDRWRIANGSLEERLIATGTTPINEVYSTRRGWRPTARAAMGMEVGQGWSFRSAAYLGWRLPTLNELFRPFRAGSDATAANPLLKPERLAGGEAGVQWAADGLRLSVTLFENQLNDAIANVTLASGPGVFPGVGFVPAGGAYRQRQNLSSIHTRGVEADGELRTGPWFARLSASYAHAEVTAGGDAGPLSGLRPAQAPHWTAAALLGWEDEGRWATVAARHVGSQFEDDLNRQLLPSATTFDASGRLPLSSRLALMLRAENLLDKEVAAAVSGGGVIERSTPRTVWLGLSFRR